MGISATWMGGNYQGTSSSSGYSEGDLSFKITGYSYEACYFIWSVYIHCHMARTVPMDDPPYFWIKCQLCKSMCTTVARNSPYNQQSQSATCWSRNLISKSKQEPITSHFADFAIILLNCFTSIFSKLIYYETWLFYDLFMMTYLLWNLMIYYELIMKLVYHDTT